jgi:HSP20 family protein
MTSMTRWDPLREITTLRQQLDRLWDRTTAWPDLWAQMTEEFGVALDVVEEDKAYTVKASLAGVKPEDIEVTLDNNVLTIKGEAKEDKTIDKESYHLRERRFGSFLRRVALPLAADVEKVVATCADGVLTVQVPKSPQATPHKIAVKSTK